VAAATGASIDSSRILKGARTLWKTVGAVLICRTRWGAQAILILSDDLAGGGFGCIPQADPFGRVP
jgi:hypothetical protein